MTNITLGRKVYETLRDRILTGDLKPNDRLLYTTVAQELDVSLSPVKEALVYLEQDGLVTLIPRKGAFVRKISREDIVEYSWIRYALECLAIDRLCQAPLPPQAAPQLRHLNKELAGAIAAKDLARSLQADNAFHAALVQASGMVRLQDVLHNLPLGNMLAVMESSGYMLCKGEHILQTHEAIIAALERSDAGKAKALLKENVIAPLDDLLGTGCPLPKRQGEEE